MRFTSIPQNYSSFLHPLIYEFSDDGSPRTLDLIIRDDMTDDTIAVKRLCNTSAGRVDIAPILRSRMNVVPLTKPGFSSAYPRALMVRTTVEDADQTRWFLPTETDMRGLSLLSTLPVLRPISAGECDELMLGPNINSVKIEVTTPAGQEAQTILNPAAGHPSIYRLDTTEVAEDFKQIVLSFSDLSGAVCHRVSYTRVPRPEEAVRVAWFSRRGSLEHYTFPVRNRQAERQERASLTLCDGRRLCTRTGHETLLTLTSAYEPREVLKALCEIGSSPALWVVASDGRYLEADVAAGERTVCEHGAISALTFTFEISETWS